MQNRTGGFDASFDTGLKTYLRLILLTRLYKARVAVYNTNVEKNATIS